MKFKEVRRLLRSLGYVIIRQDGSHEQWQHPRRPGRVTVAGRDSDEVRPRTWKSIQNQIAEGNK